MNIDKRQIRQAIDLLFEPGQVFEIRCMNATMKGERYRHKALGGYFNDATDVIKALDSIETGGVYITLNKVNQDIHSRAFNRFGDGQLTSDSDVIRRRWLFIDIDAGQPSGVSSSDAEHTAALELTQHIRDTLMSRGWPEPIMADSGNGGHLLYRVDLSKDDNTLVERVLKQLANEFNIDRAKVDTSVHNPSRILKLYGTYAQKGDNTTERPHRLAKILSMPSTPTTVNNTLLENNAIAPATNVSSAGISDPFATQKFDVEKYLIKWGVSWHTKDESKPNTIVWHLSECPLCGRTSACGTSISVFQNSSGVIGYKCMHSQCGDKHWKDIRIHFEPMYAAIAAIKTLPSSQQIVVQAPKATKIGAKDLVEFVLNNAKVRLFYTPQGEVCAALQINAHREIHYLRTQPFKQWMLHSFHATAGHMMGREALSTAIDYLEAHAKATSAPVEDVYIRIGHKDGNVYVDLGDDTHECVKIDKDGWTTEKQPPLNFIRPKGMLALPRPEPGGNLRDMMFFVGLSEREDKRDEYSWCLIASWLIMCFHPSGPYPILNFNGEHGSLKSTATNYSARLIDPTPPVASGTPKDSETLRLRARNRVCIGLDNLGYMQDWLSDDLCRLSTGMGDSTRQYYTNTEEVTFFSKRPVVYNAIEEIARRDDFLSRLLIVRLPGVEKYIDETTVDALFVTQQPKLLGALYSGVSMALKNAASVQPSGDSRMADYERWAYASALSYTSELKILKDAIDVNTIAAASMDLESPVAIALVKLRDAYKVTSGSVFEGLVTDLYDRLADKLTEEQRKDNAWPKAARKLTGRLTRLRKSLLLVGIRVTYKTRVARGQPVLIEAFPVKNEDIPTTTLLTTTTIYTDFFEEDELFESSRESSVDSVDNEDISRLVREDKNKLQKREVTVVSEEKFLGDHGQVREDKKSLEVGTSLEMHTLSTLSTQDELTLEDTSEKFDLDAYIPKFRPN